MSDIKKLLESVMKQGQAQVDAGEKTFIAQKKAKVFEAQMGNIILYNILNGKLEIPAQLEKAIKDVEPKWKEEFQQVVKSHQIVKEFMEKKD